MKIYFKTADSEGSTFGKDFDDFEDAFEHYRKADAFEDCDCNLSLVIINDDNEEIFELICENLKEGQKSKYA